jgi:Flp pilus assembly protein CpaB
MTLRVDETSAVEGWASSGAIVDVLLVDEKHTRVVAEKVKILSAERSLHSLVGEEGAEMAVPSTVTLLVTQEQCLAIHTALGLGKISFALRGLVDQDEWRNNSFAARNLGMSPQPVTEEVRGYASVQGKRSFVLLNGRWIASPEGNPLAIQKKIQPLPREKNKTAGNPP